MNQTEKTNPNRQNRQTKPADSGGTINKLGTLGGEARVAILIEKKGEREAYWEGGINGTFYRIKKGEPVEVPENLARLIRENETVAVLSREQSRPYRGGGRKLMG